MKGQLLYQFFHKGKTRFKDLKSQCLLVQSATEPFLVSSRNGLWEKRCVTRLKPAVQQTTLNLSVTFVRDHLQKTITSHDVNGERLFSYNVKKAFLLSSVFYGLVSHSRGFWNSPVIIIAVVPNKESQSPILKCLWRKFIGVKRPCVFRLTV